MAGEVILAGSALEVIVGFASRDVVVALVAFDHITVKKNARSEKFMLSEHGQGYAFSNCKAAFLGNQSYFACFMG
jgi:hypothetical protein